MAEGEQATATATAQGSEAAPAPEAATNQTQQGAGGNAGQASQQPQAETISVAKAEYDSYKANAGRFQAIQQRGDLDIIRELQDQGLNKQEIADFKAYVKTEFNGMTLKDFFAAVRTPTANAGQAGAPQQGQRQGRESDDPDQQVLTVAEFKRLQKETAEQESQAQAEAAAEKAAKDYWDGVAKEFKADSGARSKSLRGIIRDAELQVIAEDLQKRDPLLEPGDAMRQAEQYIPTKAHLDAARKRVENDWKDLGNEIVSAAAKGQEGLPGGSLGGGAGGSPPPPGKAGPMTEAQKAQAVLDAIRRSTAARGYRPPA